MIELGVQRPALGETGNAATATPQPRLVKAAHEFEAAMMKELMAPLSSGNDEQDLTGQGDDEGSSSALGSFAQEALGKAISEHGGFGIAKSIIHQLSVRGNRSGNSPVTGSPNGNPSK